MLCTLYSVQSSVYAVLRVRCTPCTLYSVYAVLRVRCRAAPDGKLVRRSFDHQKEEKKCPNEKKSNSKVLKSESLYTEYPNLANLQVSLIGRVTWETETPRRRAPPTWARPGLSLWPQGQGQPQRTSLEILPRYLSSPRPPRGSHHPASQPLKLTNQPVS